MADTPLRQVLIALIVDSQAELESGGQKTTPRNLDYAILPGKALVCVGARRSGKSTFLAQIMRRLLDEGVPPRKILYINFFDDRLRPFTAKDLAEIVEAYHSLHDQEPGTVHAFFDEIQEVPGYEAFVDRLLHREKWQVYITGSSAKMLSREVATQLRGRSLSWELFPFSFSEYLTHVGVKARFGTTSFNRELARKFEIYFEEGGFPEVSSLPSRLRIRIHQEYFHAMLYRDIIERSNTLHPNAVRDTALRLIHDTGSLFSVNRLSAYLKGLGYRASKSFASECVEWFEDAYFLFQIRIYDASIARQNANPRKIYAIDHALAASVASKMRVDSGHLLENLVFLHLRRRTEQIHYYKTASGKEVDFVWIDEKRQKHAVQVCETIVDSTTRNRELVALTESCQELGLNEGWIVTRHEEENILHGSLNIHVIPAWKYVFDLGV